MGETFWASMSAAPLGKPTASAGGRATIADIDRIAEEAAASDEISVEEAREIEIELLETGRIGVELFLPIVELAEPHAAKTGVDFDTAKKNQRKPSPILEMLIDFCACGKQVRVSAASCAVFPFARAPKHVAGGGHLPGHGCL